jgi:hypothetical protein
MSEPQDGHTLPALASPDADGLLGRLLGAQILFAAHKADGRTDVRLPR